MIKIGKYELYNADITKDYNSIKETPDRHFLETVDTVKVSAQTKQWPNTEAIFYTPYQDALVVVGESWTYGDSLAPYVKAFEGKDNLAYRAITTFAGHLGLATKSDLYLFATPGASNILMFNDLEHILEHIRTNCNYNKVRVVIQMTSPGRDIGHTNYFEKYKLKELFSTDPDFCPSLDLNNFFKEYECRFLNRLDELVSTYKPDKTVLWKNFNNIIENDTSKYSFNIVKDPAHSYLCELSGITTKLGRVLEKDFFEKAPYLTSISTSEEELIREMEIVEQSYRDLSRSVLNDWHMNPTGHWIWASKLYDALKN